MEHYDDSQALLKIGISASPTDWIPFVLLEVSVDEEDAADGRVKLAFTPDQALSLGGSLIQSGLNLSSFYEEFSDKTPEQRQEILMLEESFYSSNE